MLEAIFGGLVKKLEVAASDVSQDFVKSSGEEIERLFDEKLSPLADKLDYIAEKRIKESKLEMEALENKTKADNALAEIAGMKNQQVVKKSPPESHTEPVNVSSNSNISANPTGEVILILNNVSGMTTAHPRDFEKSRQIFVLKDRTSVRIWTNPVGVDHVFLADLNGRMVYGGFVGWIHAENLTKALEDIRKYFT